MESGVSEPEVMATYQTTKVESAGMLLSIGRMSRRNGSRQKLILAFGDAALIIGILLFACMARYGVSGGVAYAKQHFLHFILMTGAFSFLINLLDLHQLSEKYHTGVQLLRLLAGSAVSAIVVSALLFLFETDFSRGIMLIQTLLSPVALVLWRTLFAAALPLNDIVILTSDLENNELVSILKQHSHSDVGTPHHFHDLGQLREQLEKNGHADPSNGIQLLIYSDAYTRKPEFSQIVEHALARGMQLWSFRDICEWASEKVPFHLYSRAALLDCLLEGRRRYNHRIRRGIDIVFSTLILFLSAPLLLVSAILIRLESAGPIFYTQERVGRHGTLFSILKFRTMHVMERGSQIVYAGPDDPRITRIGKWLRRFRIDEFPQLVNVLRGQMSLIGPRPEIASYVDTWNSQLPYYSLRTLVPQGITGWAQVNHSYATNSDDKSEVMAYDLYYIKNYSLFLDLRIVLRTMRVLLFGRGR